MKRAYIDIRTIVESVSPDINISALLDTQTATMEFECDLCKGKGIYALPGDEFCHAECPSCTKPHNLKW